MTENYIMQDAVAVRVVPDSIYRLMTTHHGGTYTAKDGTKVAVKAGTMKVLAQGTDATGKPVYLIRDEVLGVGTQVSSTFVHSQFHIETELLPSLIKVRNALILPVGTDATLAQALADKQGFPAYVSLVDEDDKTFALNDATGKPTYVQYNPKGADKARCRDSIAALNDEVMAWLRFLVKNEEEKVTASELVKNYDFDGAANVQYSETFTCAQDRTAYLRWPFLNGFGGGTGQFLGSLGKWLENIFSNGKVTGDPQNVQKDGGEIVSEVIFANTAIKFKFKPILSVNVYDKNNIKESWSKKIGFTLSTAGKSNLNVDVYRTKKNFLDITQYDLQENVFYKLTTEYLDNVRNGSLGTNATSYMDKFKTPVYSGFVYRTRGGATCQPYEDERTTKYYNPGTVLDARTVEIDKLRIWTEQAIVSNVPYDEPARFTLYMANESELPDQASLAFRYFLDNTTNAKGAKVYVDGNALNGDGYSVMLRPGQVVTKQVEVYPNSDFDYENIGICLYDTEDAIRISTTLISAHFVPSAGKVKVTSPSDKWVVNTESAFDYAQQAYYLPVRIEGFDVNYRGFDHIELQYKLSTQGDKDWINVCAFYNDRELMALASGVVDSIPADGAIQTRFFGEADPIEQHYDLRAVVYCRYGNGFLTAASPVLTGIKDTRRPVPFGTPTPVSGVLGIGDDIAISFSEDIAGNYLSKINNFEVLGSPRSGDISTSTCLSFTDNSAAMSAAPLNLTGKSFTVDLMLNPAATQKAMTVFAHGGDEQGLKFGLTEDRRLTAIVNGKQVSSDTSVPFNGLRQVAYALEQGSDAMTIRFYDGSRLIGQQQISGVYRGNSELLLGFDFDILVDPQASTLSYYNGDMLEFRIWNRVLSAAEMAEYGQKSLTGYEHGLLCNYTLNEGEGRYSYDRAVSGIDLELNGTSWKRPQGVAMHFDGRDGICLKPDCFARTDAQDYTLMFWFNTAEAEGTLLANGEARNEPEARNHINVGLDGGRLFVRSGGREFRTEATCNDAQWHHFAMTVSRSRNVGNIYVDKRLVESFSVDSLGGIQGNNLALGATYTSATNALRPLRGYIDEVGLFSSVLPVNLLQSYVNKTPTGTESSLLAYLDFGRNEQQDDNTQRLMPTGISRKRYKDARGNLVARRDTLVAQDVIEAHAARDSYAPMTRNNKLDNVNFSYVANGNKLLLNLDVPDFQIEKSNVYVTVKDVQDMNGNYMASPLTMDFYVYRNPLRWNVQHVELNTAYGEEQSFEVTIRNLSGQTQRFQLRDLPYWLSASLTQGSIAALDEQKITFSISPYTNIGSYTELITLAADNDMTEPLSLNVKVAGEQPAWAVSDDLKANNLVMNIVARAYIDGVVAADPNDILVAFGPNQEVMGVAHIDADQTANANEVLTWLTVYGHRKQATELEFRIYDASSGQVYKLQPRGNQRVTFQPDAILGSSTSPLLLENADSNVETLHLRKGWNWVSFNVAQKEAVTLGELFYGAAPWQHGDAIEIINDKSATTYFCRKDQTIRGYKWDKDNQLVQIDPTRMYRIYSGSKKVAYFGGQTVDDDITVHHGWNRIAYLSQLNLPIAQAMAVYLSEASEGDVLKSQDDFAILSRDASGNLVWKGTLRYLETGRGYMLKRTADNDATFYYPSYYADSRYSGSTSAPRRTTLLENSSATSMNIVARVSGVEQQEDDRLVAYNGTCRIGVAQADEDGLFFLNLAQAEGEARSLTFCLERNEQVVGTALSNYSYEADAVIGSPDQPTGIYFAPSAYDYSDGHWYTLDSVRLPRKPQRAGLYIHNGKVTNEK